MGRVQRVPGWVRRPVAVVAGVEDFLLRVFGETDSPEVLGSRAALAWLGGIDPQPPLTIRQDPLSQARAIAEFMIAYAVSTGEAYPPVGWWAEHGAGLDGVLCRSWWQEHTGYGWSCSYAGGVAVAVGWALGVIDDPAHMSPQRAGDGSVIPDRDRAQYARVLRTLTAWPARPGPAPAARRGPVRAGGERSATAQASSSPP